MHIMQFKWSCAIIWIHWTKCNAYTEVYTMETRYKMIWNSFIWSRKIVHIVIAAKSQSCDFFNLQPILLILIHLYRIMHKWKVWKCAVVTGSFELY